MLVDTTFDYRSDSNGKDPDKYSPTLRRHHQILWSKPLPNGKNFELNPEPGNYLAHRSELGTFLLSSDTISNSLRAQKRMAPIISQVQSSSLDEFQRLGSTAGAVVVFPGKQINGKVTINVARGFLSVIGDRIDLTLECIRRNYEGAESPLAETLNRYCDFFELFESFESYVEFFLFQDLVEDGRIKFFLPFTGEFDRKANPKDLDEYLNYMRNAMDFVRLRNRRIASFT